ncbi:hypothetical protein NIES4073_70910 [Kalymmatonema gypsitolerans NIES-4073]|nr:hypothetical protein NIES4073_70910 [Scytonema sp. NIES-4073]
MNTNKTASITSIIEKRLPLAEKIAGIEAELKSLDSAIRHLQKYRYQLLRQVDDPNVAGLLGEINLATLQFSINTELEALVKLKERFCRKTLNIGVVGRAKQGKSRLLQSLTGLTGAEIPDGERHYCTAARSIIYNNHNEETYAEVWFHSEQSFLDEVISPCYEKLGLSEKPKTIDEFAAKPLPLLPSDDPKYPEQGGMYEQLAQYHIHWDKYRHLFQQPSPRRISKDQIRKYVAQETPYVQRIFFNPSGFSYKDAAPGSSRSEELTLTPSVRVALTPSPGSGNPPAAPQFHYLAVREVKIVCKYPNADVGQIAFVDMPGLGDTGICDQQHLMKILGQQVDVILFVRMPKSTGDSWMDVDLRLYDTVRGAQADLPINLWSFMVLNRTEVDSRFRDNSKSCQDLAQDIANKNIDIVECVTANCANTQEADKVLERVLDYLKANITDLDYKYASLCQQRLILLQNQVKAELEKVSKALDLATHDDIHRFAVFEVKFKELWWTLTNSLEKLLKDLRKKREAVDMDFKKQVEAAFQACRSDTGIPSIQEIEQRFCVEKSYAIVYEKYLNEIRAHLSKHLLLIDIGLERSLDKVKSQVAYVLMEKGHLGKLTQAKGTEFFADIAAQIPDELLPGIPSQLKYGFQTLAEFKLSYRGLLQYRIRKHLDGLTPNEPATLKLSGSPSAEQVVLNLKIAYAETIGKCEKALKELLSEPSLAIYAIVEEFIDCILRTQDIESEWRIFLQGVREQIWQELQPLGHSPRDTDIANRTQLQREVLHSVEQATAANQSELMHFLQ